MKDILEKISRYASGSVFLITVGALIVGNLVLQFIPLSESIKSIFDAVYRGTVVIVLLELLCLAFLIHQRVSILPKASGLEYINAPAIRSLTDASKTHAVRRVFILASSLGRSEKEIIDLLRDRDCAGIQVNVFYSDENRLPEEVKNEVRMAKNSITKDGLKKHFNLYRVDNPPSVGFQAFCDEQGTVKELFLNWYTFYAEFDGNSVKPYSRMGGRGSNGGLRVRSGVSSDADSLLGWARTEIEKKLNDPGTHQEVVDGVLLA